MAVGVERKPDPPPLEGNIVLAVAVGTALWLVAGVALIRFHRHLNQHGHLWWIAAAFTGAGLGLVGLLVVTRRERRLRGRRRFAAEPPAAARARGGIESARGQRGELPG